MQGKANSVGVITVIFFSALAGFFVFGPAPVSAYTSHDPILIVGNENFTTANGVTGGNGTEADPYVIDGWEIINSSNNYTKCIEIINTMVNSVSNHPDSLRLIDIRRITIS